VTRDADTSEIYREVNEQIQQLNHTFGLTNGERLQIVCECARPDCAQPIDLTMDEYEQLRADASHFAIKPGHPFPQGDAPESRHKRFWIVTVNAAEEQESRRGA
jgi:hypothetical protein